MAVDKQMQLAQGALAGSAGQSAGAKLLGAVQVMRAKKAAEAATQDARAETEDVKSKLAAEREKAFDLEEDIKEMQKQLDNANKRAGKVAKEAAQKQANLQAQMSGAMQEMQQTFNDASNDDSPEVIELKCEVSRLADDLKMTEDMLADKVDEVGRDLRMMPVSPHVVCVLMF